MARVTVEDCILNVPNRFELVLLAAQRAKQISSGNPLTIDRDNDKDAVVSLREIAGQTISLDGLEEDVIQSFFKRPISDITDKKLLTNDEEVSNDVEEAFKDATSDIAVDSLPAKEMLPVEGQSAEGQSAEGMSFTDENIDTDD